MTFIFDLDLKTQVVVADRLKGRSLKVVGAASPKKGAS